MDLIRQLLLLAISLMMAAIIASVIISWLRAAGLRLPHYNPFVRAIESIADSLLRPIRNAFPMTGGGLDFSPMVAIILLEILRRIVARLF